MKPPRVVGKVTGFDAVYKRLESYESEMSESRMSNRARAAADYAELKAYGEMLRTPAGRWHKGNVRHSSLPGNYPAIQHEDLADSMNTEIIGPGKAAWNAGGGDVAQAFYMEFGTSEHDPRPFMRPTLIKFEKGIRERMRARKTSTFVDAESFL